MSYPQNGYIIRDENPRRKLSPDWYRTQGEAFAAAHWFNDHFTCNTKWVIRLSDGRTWKLLP